MLLYRFILLGSSTSQSSLGVHEPTVLEASEEERVVAEEEEAVRQAQVGVVVTFVLNEWWLNLLSSRRFAAAPRVGLETRLW